LKIIFGIQQSTQSFKDSFFFGRNSLVYQNNRMCEKKVT
jgi:hypothetical protein